MEQYILNKPLYDWFIVGGGISVIAVAEILFRENKSVLLIEKNELLASPSLIFFLVHYELKWTHK